MTGAGRIGGSKRLDRPPQTGCLGLGAVLLAVNHLSVILKNGLLAEALVMGCWLVLVGGVLFVGPRAFDAVWQWAERSGGRVLVFVCVTLAMGAAAAETVARLGYGTSLLD